MQNLKNVRIPQGNAAGRLAGLILGGGALVYGASNSLFNVEGGHRAIVFNRVVGIKEEVRAMLHVTGSDCSRLDNTPESEERQMAGLRGRHTSHGTMVRSPNHI